MNGTSKVVASGLVLSLALFTSPAQALNARSFVSGHGADTNNCTLAAPCRTLAVALAQTRAGGEIDVLDSAGYGAVTITQAISIVNDGVGTASILVSPSGAGVTVGAGANDAVSLRGLTIEGAGIGATGIAFNSGQSLTVENCVIRNVYSEAIDFHPNATSNLAVSNTIVADNYQYGILVAPTGAGVVTAVFNRVQLHNNGVVGIYIYGAYSTGKINATVSESVAAGNRSSGFAALSASGFAPTTLTVFRSVSANNYAGIAVGGIGGTLRVAQSVVSGNTIGWSATGSGILQSYGDNYIDGNGSNDGILTPVSRR